MQTVFLEAPRLNFRGRRKAMAFPLVLASRVEFLPVPVYFEASSSGAWAAGRAFLLYPAEFLTVFPICRCVRHFHDNVRWAMESLSGWSPLIHPRHRTECTL
ncbi:hypothetical protein CEXT_516871 [Caerostris extrusa]|uniref:Uncharacterized protein n=1 Tax=Caerostris extrusa TaxID=172846 RepID=A0AAV4MQD6_CAEEX|nr:hypothetical protein CEXT_516871 [Caerostris extrusa]